MQLAGYRKDRKDKKIPVKQQLEVEIKSLDPAGFRACAGTNRMLLGAEALSTHDCRHACHANVPTFTIPLSTHK